LEVGFIFDAVFVKSQIIKWISEYFKDNATSDTKAVIGISGGKDSAAVAALCVSALGVNRVIGVLMPNGEQPDIDVSYDLCKTLGIEYVEVNISEAVKGLYASLAKTGMVLNDVATFNTPARIRMTTLYAISGIVGGRVANTSNLSEDYVGYATKFGDSAGDFAPLMDLTVSEVKAIGRELGLASRFVDKVPLDGLSGKTDEDNLGFTYDVLDRYIREGVCDDSAVREKIDRLHVMNLHKVKLIPVFRL